jgi:glutamate/tyrosine decarboxylase-like PLP-dependent enzyme
VTSFDLTPQKREELLGLLLGKLESYYADTDSLRVSPPLDIEQIQTEVQELFEASGSELDATNTLVEKLKTFSVHTPHPDYFGLYNPRANFAGILSDIITAYFNPQLAAWSHSPFAAEVESFLIKEFGQRFGYPTANADGVFATGGAEANLTAVLCALKHALPDYAVKGLMGLNKRPMVYCSNESHHSIVKATRMVGLGSDSVRNVAVQSDLNMDTEALSQLIQEDLDAGHQPFMVVGTAGTTGTGAIDDLSAIHSIAKQYNLWFHVDGAYGGSAIISNRLKPLLKGIKHSDSITMDAHKWMSVPMGTSMFLTQHPNILSETFSTSNNYMPKDAGGLQIVDPFNHSVQWSRRSLGLRVYLSLLFFGWDGYEEVINHQTDMGEYLRTSLTKNGWTITNQSAFPVICFTHPEYANDSEFATYITSKVVKSGLAWVSTYPVHGTLMVRACITNYSTQKSNIDHLVQLVNDAKNEYEK